jgi:photosystem II stability/assembly factor-like uncharacterized protein
VRVLALAGGLALAVGTSGAAAATPSPAAAPSSAYHPVRVVGAQPAVEPVNQRTAYAGQPLLLASHLVPSQAREPALALNRQGDVFFAAKAGNAPAGGAPHLIYRSSDSGQTWQEKSGDAVQKQLFFSVADPYVEVDADTGRMFWAGIAIPRPAVFAFSADRGETWTTTEAYAAGANDHETVIAGKVPAGSTLTPTDPTFPKIVYYCTNGLYLVGCSRSLDGGKTFVPVTGRPLAAQSEAQCGSETGFMTADSDGRIYIGGANCGVPQVSMSDDAGDTWHDVTVSDAIQADHHDVEVATDSAGNVYALWLNTHHLPYLAVSRDHGATWSDPLMVAAPDVRSAGFAELAAGDTGRVAVSYVGTTSTDTADTHRPWQYYVGVSQNALDDSPLFVTNVAPTADGSGIVNRGDCCPGMYDYLDVDVAPTLGGPVWASLSNVCSAACATDPNGVDDVYPGQGYAIQEVSGPALTGADPYLPGTPADPVVPESPIGVLIPVVGVLTLGSWLVLRRRTPAQR